MAGGFRLLAKKPLPLMALLVFDIFLLVMPSVLPVIGPLIPTILTPVFAVGLMVAMRATERGENPMPQMLFAAFGPAGGFAWRRLLALGVIDAIAISLAIGLSALLDGGALLDAIVGLEDAAPAGDTAAGAEDLGAGADTSLLLPAAMPALALFLLLLLPIQAASWYAPLFVAWHRIAVVKSLFFSLVAVWRNKGAFAVYIASWLGAAVVISTVLGFTRSVSPQAGTLVSMLLFFVSIALLVAMYGSVWLSYRDVITPQETLGPGGGG